MNITIIGIDLAKGNYQNQNDHIDMRPSSRYKGIATKTTG